VPPTRSAGTHAAGGGMTMLERTLREPGATVELLDEDPDLFDGVRPMELRRAQARLRAKVHGLRRGRWSGTVSSAAEPAVGLLVLDGLVLRTVEACGRRGSELLGPGDLLRPWEHDGAAASIPFDVRWDVLETCRIAVLDQRFLEVANEWPEVLSALFGRAVQRAQWLALQLTIANLRRVDDRLLAAFWHFADRWGTAGPDGVVVPLAVTHDVLAQIVSAQRPTVTAALHRLQETGRVRRDVDRTWLLLGGPLDTALALLDGHAIDVAR